ATPFDPLKLVRASLPDAREKKADGLGYYYEEKTGTALHVLNDRTFLFGDEEKVKHVLTKRKASGVFEAALAQAAANRPLVAAFTAARGPPQAAGALPRPLRPLIGAQLVTLTVELAAEARLDLRLQYANEEETAAGEQALKAGVQMARQGIVMAKGEVE